MTVPEFKILQGTISGLLISSCFVSWEELRAVTHIAPFAISMVSLVYLFISEFDGVGQSLRFYEDLYQVQPCSAWTQNFLLNSNILWVDTRSASDLLLAGSSTVGLKSVRSHRPLRYCWHRKVGS